MIQQQQQPERRVLLFDERSDCKARFLLACKCTSSFFYFFLSSQSLKGKRDVTSFHVCIQHGF
jgi:hypothetical protein